MRKRLVAMLLVINMLASILLCVGGSGLGAGRFFTAGAIDVDVSSCSVGDTVVFGSYEQDNNTSNGKEPIEWIVIDISDGKLMLLSKYILDNRQYHIHYNQDSPECPWRTSWEACKLRSYMNNEFYNAAFSAGEQQHICFSYLENHKNPELGTNGGNNTTDKVFMLSQNEFDAYVKDTSFAKGTPTRYTKNATGLATASNGCSNWWLRTPGKHVGNAEYVKSSGVVSKSGSDVGHTLGVRPAIRIQQNAVKATESISLSFDSKTVKASDPVSVTATVTPADSGYPVVWSSSDTNVAKVDSKGNITIVGLGKVTISVRSGGCSDSCELNVIPGFALKAVGGSVRVIDPYGLRFGIQLMKDEAYNKSSKSIVEYGTLIIPKDNMEGAQLDLSTPKVMKLAANNIYSSDSTQLTYTGVLVGIPDSSFDDVIVGRGYLTYKDADGTKHTIYTDVIERTYREVAEAAFERYAAMPERSATEESVYQKLKEIIETINGADTAAVPASVETVSGTDAA